MNRVFQCENCGSLFIVNQFDPRFQSGDYGIPDNVSCPLCNADLEKSSLPKSKEDDSIFFEEIGKKIIKLIGKEDTNRFFKLITEEIQFCIEKGWGYAERDD
jgi:rubredoxin